MFGKKILTSIQNSFLPPLSSSASAHFTPDTSPPPVLLHSVPLVQQQMAQRLAGVRHSGFSAVPNSFPLFLSWSSMGCRQWSTCVIMENLPLTWICYSLVLSSIPLSSACPAFLPFLKRAFPQVPPHLSGSAVPWVGSVGDDRNHQCWEKEQNTVMLILGGLSKSVMFKIHLASLLF